MPPRSGSPHRSCTDGSRGDTFVADGRPPGAMPIAVADGLLYLGPFAVPRN